MNSESNIWWIGPLVLTLMRLLYVEARLSHASNEGKMLLFRGSIGWRCLLLVGVLGFSFLTIRSIGHEETWLLVAGAASAIAGCFGWPATIIVDDRCVSSRVWWKPNVSIPWNEVSGIERNAGGDIQVFGSHGQSINFTRYHIDPLRFQDEAKKRARLASVIKASDSPTIRI